MKIKVRFIEEDHGNCRKYYRNIENKRLYVLQQGFKDSWSWYTCTKDGEPDMPFKDGIEVEIISEAQFKLTNAVDKLPTLKLLELWKHTEEMVTTEETYILRGEIMDALEKRDHNSFNKWMSNVYDKKHPEKDQPDYYFLEDALLRQSNVDDYNSIFGKQI